jgi:phage N-6-adenine-methyltransferase
MGGPTIKRGESSGDIWTPWSFIHAVEARFGKLTRDLAASGPQSAKAPRWITPEQDSLSIDWYKDFHGLDWLNCPYGNIAPWAGKCAWEMTQGWRGFLLVPGSIGANWFKDAVWPYADTYSVGRMVFDNCFDKNGKPVRTPYPKDLILGHFDRRKNTGSKLIFWKDWAKSVPLLTEEETQLVIGAIPLQAL